MTKYQKKKERAILKALGVRQWLYFESYWKFGIRKNKPQMALRRIDSLTGYLEVFHSEDVWVKSEWQYAKDFINSVYRK